MSDELGYTCSCGHFNKAGMWAAAHWSEVLMHKCEGCKMTNFIKEGEVVEGPYNFEEEENDD